ncbi:MAG: four helix bundle protein [Patescibacteria group bacterium]
MGRSEFHNQLKTKMDKYVHAVYTFTKSFPKDELYGVTSQLRRATLSVILNYIEGYARKKRAVCQNYWEISYGSLKESKYLVYFSYKENYLTKVDYSELIKLADEIGAMLWSALESKSNLSNV